MTEEDRQIVANEAKKLSSIMPYSYDKYIEFMNELIAQHPFSYFSIAKGERFSALWKDVVEKTSFIDEHFKPKAATRIFYYINKLSEIVRCETDGKPLLKDISPVRHPAHFFCCNRCAQLHESTIAKTKATKLKNHGDPNWNNMEKNRATCKKHFGVECSWQAEEVKQKSRETLKRNLGVDHQMRSQEVKDGMKARYKEKHGVEYTWQDPAVKEKIAEKRHLKSEQRRQAQMLEESTIEIYSQEVLREKIMQVIEEHPDSFGRIIKSKHYDPSILASLKHWCPKVADDEYSVQTKIFWFLNRVTEFPRCGNKACTNTFEHRNVIDWKHGYRKNCCPQCAKDSDERKELYVKACQNKYGVDNASQADEVKVKKAQSAMDKYGVDCVSKAPEVQATIQQTNMDRYGAKMYMLTEEALAKRRQKHMEEYGVDWPQKSREFMRRIQKRYTYDDMNFDSKPELAYYIWLKDHNIEFTYQPDIAFEYEHEGMKHVYEPDFIVENVIVEVKGDHFFKDDGTMCNPFDSSQDALYEAKHKCMLENNVKIMKSAEYELYVDYVEKTYGKDWLQSFKNQ